MNGVGDGIGGGAPPGATATPTGREVSVIVSNGVADAARPAVAFAGAVVTIGALISLLVPNIPAEPEVPSVDWSAAGPAAETEPDADSELEPYATS